VIVIIFGVSGSGKTTLGKLLAHELDWRFYEADDFHSPVNIEKMRRGVALTDEDRWPWLQKLRQLIEKCVAGGENAVLACSALKHAYRDQLRISEDVKFIFLHGDYALIEQQLRRRHRHFMNPSLLRSQFVDLEEPQSDEGVLTIELGRTPHELVEEIKIDLHLISKN
jgi:carbohydrate kinase, thermoresistant glucokinase family